MGKHKWKHRDHRRYHDSDTSSSCEINESYLDGDENVDRFRNQLRRRRFVLIDVPADGNCLFSAFSDQLFGHTNKHEELRNDAVAYLRRNECVMRPFYEQDNWCRMVDQLSQPGTYGDHISMVALSHCYNVDVIMHQVDLAPFVVAQASHRDSHTNQVHLAFYNNEHFMSVRKLRDKGGAANVFISPKKLDLSSDKQDGVMLKLKRLSIHQ